MPDLHPPGRLLPQSPRRVFVWGYQMTAHWIKVEKSTPAKPEVMQLAAILGIDEFTVVGHLVAFWCWADTNLSPECPAAHGTIRGLDRVAGRDGFCGAMIQVGWLQHQDGRFSVPNLDRHMGKSAKMRAEDTEKKRKQRLSQKCPVENGTTVPDATGQNRDQRREEKILKETPSEPQNKTEQGQPFIPEKVNTPECLRAYEDWCNYLEAAGLNTKNPRNNAIQAEAVWRQASRIGPERWPDAVTFSIANGYQSIVNRTDAPGSSSKTSDKPKGPSLDFLKAVRVCQEYPSASDYDREKRETLLGPDLMRTVRKMGTPRLAECDRFTQGSLSAEWNILRESGP
jgi:hypothetical protein